MNLTFATSVTFSRRPPRLEFFDFQRLPYVVQKKIVQKMKAREIFTLSATSSKMCDLLKLLKATQIEFAVFSLVEKNVLKIDFRIKKQRRCNWTVKLCDTSMDKLKFRIRGFVLGDDGNFDISIGTSRKSKEDIIYRGLKSTSTQLHFNAMAKRWHSVFQFFNSIFQGPCYHLKIDGSLLKSNFLPPPMEKTQYLTVSGETVQWSALLKLSERLEVANVVKIDGEVAGDMDGFDTLPTHTLILKNATWLTIDQLLSIDCRYFYAYNASLTTRNIVEFVSEWKISRNWKLKYLDIKMSYSNEHVEFSTRDIERLNAKAWDSKIRIKDYYCNNRRLKTGKRLISCENGHDIRRSDGLIATVILTSRRFRFVVWYNRFDRN